MFNKQKLHFKIYILIFFLGNLLNAWALLSTRLNSYLISFEFSFIGFFNSFIADLAILSIFFFIGLFIFKKRNQMLLYLLFVTLGLNFFVFTMFMFMRFYSTLYTFSLDILKNPGGGLVGPVILDTISVFFLKFRFLYMLPVIILTVYYIYFRRFYEDEDLVVDLRVKVLSLSNSFLISCLTLMVTVSLIGAKTESSLDIGLFTAKHGGFYSFYVEQLLGIRFRAPDLSKMEEEVFEQYIDLFDKNKDKYINQLDNKEYSRHDDLTGVLKDYNLFVIQLESYNNFFINQKINEIEVTPNLNSLVNTNYYFSNVMTSVGMGNTSDAEFSVLTGLYSNGDSSIYWDYNDRLYDFRALPKLFNQKGYVTASYHGNNAIFYNREIAHKKMLGFSEFYSKEDFQYEETDYPDYFYNTWVNDEQILNWGLNHAVEEQKNGNNFFKFQVLLQPHTPYNSSNIVQYDWGTAINKSQLAYYLDNIKYNDYILGEFIRKAKSLLPNTLFVLYGDHGSGIVEQEIRDLLNTSNIGLRDKLNQIPVFFIDSSNTLQNYISREEFNEIASLAKSQRDIYRTIVNLFDLYEKCDEIFGVSMFSNEPSIIYEARNVDFKTDEFYANFRNTNVYINYYEEFDQTKLKAIENIIGKHRNMNNFYLEKKAKIS